MFNRPLSGRVVLGVCCTCVAVLAVVPGCVSGARRPESVASTAPAAASQPVSAPVFSVTPPTPEAPQPHFACEHPDLRLEPVWYGQEFTSVWQIANDGSAPLTVRLIP